MRYPISRRGNIVIQEIGGEVLIYDLAKNKVYCLNEISAKVWNVCDGQKSVNEIAKSLNSSEDVVCLALDQLRDEKLIEDYIGSESYFKGLTRRQIIKKVGLASMVALPLVSSLIAPKAVNAQSGQCAAPGMGGNGLADTCACVGNNDCVSGCCDLLQVNPVCSPLQVCQCASPGTYSDGCPCQNNFDCLSGCCSTAPCAPGNKCPDICSSPNVCK